MKAFFHAHSAPSGGGIIYHRFCSGPDHRMRTPWSTRTPLSALSGSLSKRPWFFA